MRPAWSRWQVSVSPKICSKIREREKKKKTERDRENRAHLEAH